jgi:DNA-binding NarL/FixJ family response regulator
MFEDTPAKLEESHFDVLVSQTRRLRTQFDRLSAVVQKLNRVALTSRELRKQYAARRAARAAPPANGNRHAPSPARDARDADDAGATSVPGKLTRRMRQILPLLMQGLSEKEVARRLGCSPHTVHIHVTRMYARLGVHSRAELLALTYQSRGAVAVAPPARARAPAPARADAADADAPGGSS